MMWKSLFLLASACPTLSQRCDSRRVEGLAIKHINGHEGPYYDVPSASACEQKCCSASGCTGWSWTSTPRSYCPNYGCCFTKAATSSDINQHLAPFDNFTTGCIGFNCSIPHPPAPSPAPSPSPLPFPYVSPVFQQWFTFAEDDAAYLRDPTTALFDSVTQSWHVYSTSILHSFNTKAGYRGSIRHFSVNGSLDAGPAADPMQKWTDHGLVLEPSAVDAAFDASGVFTPGAVRECDPNDPQVCKWFLFFGGVQNQSRGHSEMVGVATATSPFGPYVRYAANPIFSYFDQNSAWCGLGEAARVDEIKPFIANGKKILAVKSVCNNFTALPVLYSPVDQSSWAPPYEIATNLRSPLFNANQTCGRKGFEEPTLFIAPDGFLHFLGHNHGKCASGKYAHFISRSRDAAQWVEAPMFDGQFMEPVPIPVAGDGVFGAEIRDQWIDFVDLDLHFHNVSWQRSEPQYEFV